MGTNTTNERNEMKHWTHDWQADDDVIACDACGLRTYNMGAADRCSFATPPPSFSKTETLRRLRIGAKLIRQAERFPTNMRTEVGLRIDPNNYATLDDALAAPDNDLDDIDDLPGASRNSDVQQHGYIANIYFYTRDAELVDVQNVWLGTPDHEPVLMHRTQGLITEGGTK